MSFVDPAGARVHRWDGTQWVDVTVTATPVEAAANWLCGQLASAAELDLRHLHAGRRIDRVRTVVGNGNPRARRPRAGRWRTRHRRLSARHRPWCSTCRGRPRTSVTARESGASICGRHHLHVRGHRLVRQIASEIDGADALTVDIWAGVMAVDRNGNLFIPGVNGCSILRVDLETRQIRRVAAWARSGHAVVPQRWRRRPGIAADVNISGGMVFDADGDLFFTQTIFGEAGYRVRQGRSTHRGGPDHLITGDDVAETIGTVAGGGTEWPPQTGDPRLALIDASDLAFNQQEPLYRRHGVRRASHTGRGRLDHRRTGGRAAVHRGRAVDPDLCAVPGRRWTALDANLNGPRGIDILPNGDLLIATHRRIGFAW